MASLHKEHGDNGDRRWRILVVPPGAPDKRRTITLGAMTERQALAMLVLVQDLEAVRETGVMDQDVRLRVGKLSDKLHGRLVRVGLLSPRETAAPVLTLGMVLDRFFEVLAVKPQTKVTYLQTRAAMEGRFTKERAASTITTHEVEQWRKAMETAGLAPSTVSKRIKTARQIFRSAVTWKLLEANPFEGVRAGAQVNRDRLRFIEIAAIEAIMEWCPDAEWRLIVGLSRYGGLRCPSEHLALVWKDIDLAGKTITVRSQKTEGQGKASRRLPLFPELVPLLTEAREVSPKDCEHVVWRHRKSSARATTQNFRTQFKRIILKAGLEAWPRLFHNLRASRQTELTRRFPAHVVSDWLGNSEAIAAAHYLQTTGADFTAASTVSTPAAGLATPVATEGTGNGGQAAADGAVQRPKNAESAAPCPNLPQPSHQKNDPKGNRTTPDHASIAANCPTDRNGGSNGHAAAERGNLSTGELAVLSYVLRR